jgi:predicted metal-binding membrane protein
MERQPSASAQPATAFPACARAASGLLGGQAAVIGALLTLAGLAWLATGLRMAGMDAGPGTNPGALGFYVSTWVVMMAAMMLPSIVPTVSAYRNLHSWRHGHRRSAQAGDTGLFLVGYLAIWAAVGLLGYAALEVGRSLDGGLFAWGRAGRLTAAAVLLLAALYELAPAKSRCLTRCRSPRSYLLESWREGRGGALRMGIEHGGWCLGCCWALMAALFALGAMSLAWMVLISVLIAAEKLLPWRALAISGVAAALVAIAIGVAAAPTAVPALTIPGSPTAMRAMGMSVPGHMRMLHAKPMAHPMGSMPR